MTDMLHLIDASLPLAALTFGPGFWIASVCGVMIVAVIAKEIRRRNIARQSQSSADEASRPMGRSDFWDVIEAAKAAAGHDPQQRPPELLRALRSMEPDDIAKFDARYREEKERADRGDLRTAAHLIRGGCTDMDFSHFRDWLLSEGKATFEAALKNADSLAELGKRDVVLLEPFAYSAKRAYKSQANAQLPGSSETAEHATRTPEFDLAAAKSALPALAGLYA